MCRSSSSLCTKTTLTLNEPSGRGVELSPESESIETVVEVMGAVHEGDVFVGNRLESQLLQNLAFAESSQHACTGDDLSNREMQVFQMLGQGKTIKEIQEQLRLSRKTVETYRRRAKEKMDLDSVSELPRDAVLWTHGLGLHGHDGRWADTPTDSHVVPSS